MPRRGLRIDTAVQFFPRGGSAHVVNYLNRELAARGCATTVMCGSLGQPGQFSHAPTFYAGLRIVPYDYNPAARAYREGRPSMDGQAAPFHPSFEDRGPAAPDRQATAVGPATFTHLIGAWHRQLALHRSRRPDVLHLHHLSHLQEAARRAYPATPRLTTLHGTDLKLLEQAHAHLDLARRAGTTPEHLAALARAPEGEGTLDRLARSGDLTAQEAARLATTDWTLWSHTRSWTRAMEHWVRHCGTLVTVSASDRRQAAALLPVAEEQITVVPNGADLTRFTPRLLTHDQRVQHLTTWLVDNPQGWAPGQDPGTVRYTHADIQRLVTPEGRLRPIVLWVGRYQRVKRLGLLLDAFARVLPALDPRPALVLWGGAPGECEGEHPLDAARRLGIEADVYLVGWRGHDELPTGLALADVMAAPAVNESFGMVYVESMAAGTPPIATHTGGPADFIASDGPFANGWTVVPDDVDDLARVLRHALTDHAERRRRGANAAALARASYGWPMITDRYAQLYDALRPGPAPAGTGEPTTPKDRP
ncbi:glycosyltransferase family 4 protein [Kitasatospora sp. NPDC059088]|uniref:glycosyltransferase family 4 protein n=1 Tax=Kitasatospora sp. NPDC059088 TaxID=3346722 RepID=UPI00368A2865